MTTGSEHVDQSVVELRLEPWAYPGEAKLYVRADHEKQLRELLTAAGITNGRVYEFHYEPILVAVVISVGTPAAWKALATVVTAFLEHQEAPAAEALLSLCAFLARYPPWAARGAVAAAARGARPGGQ